MTSISAAAAADGLLRAVSKPVDPPTVSAGASRLGGEFGAGGQDEVAGTTPPAQAVERDVQTFYDPAAHHTVSVVTDRHSGAVVETLPGESLLKFYVAFHAEIEGKQPAG